MAEGSENSEFQQSAYIQKLQQEITRLQNDNDRLKNDLAARDPKNADEVLIAEGTVFISEIAVRKAIARQLRNSSRLLQATKCVYLLHDGKNELIAQRPTLGLDETELAKYHVPVGRGISGEVFRTRKLVRVDNISEDPRSGEEPLEELGAENGVCVPLLLQVRDEENRIIDSRSIGVLWVMNSRAGHFTGDDERMLTVFARQVAAVVGNAQYIAKLQQQSRAMINTFENLPAGILFVGEDDRIRLINASARQLLGLPEGRGVGEPYYRAIEHNQTCDLLMACMRDNEDKSAQVPFKIDKDEHIYLIQAARVSGGNEELDGIVAVFDDVTEIHNLDNLKQEFVQTFTSELLGPLASIRGFTTMLQRVEPDEFPGAVRQEIDGIMGQECDRLRRHIQDLLNVSRVEQGIRPHLNLSRFAFDTLIHRVVDRISQLTRKHTFEVSVSQPLPKVFGDELRLEEVAYNLVSNAIRYSPDGGTIAIRVYTQDDTVRVQVTDQGIGIEAGQMEEIFRKFAHVKPTDERVHGGRGIGLFISRFFVEAHGGRIGVESKPGEGSTFWFYVPVEAKVTAPEQ